MGLCVVVIMTVIREQLVVYCAHTLFNCWLMLILNVYQALLHWDVQDISQTYG